MKKILVLATMVALALTCLVACGEDMSDSPYVGEYTATTAEYSGFEMGVADIMGGDVILTLEANGKCNLQVTGEDYPGKWTEADGGVMLDDEFYVAIEGNAAVMDYDGVILYFVRG